MVTLELEGKKVRALAMLGGRNLVKCTEALASAIVLEFRKTGHDAGSMSDGKQIKLKLGEQPVAINFNLAAPRIEDSGYYRYQEGTVVFESSAQALNAIKKIMLKLADNRRDYLLERYSEDDLKRYAMNKEYIRNLPNGLFSTTN